MDTANTLAQDRSGAPMPAATDPLAGSPLSTEALIQAAIEEARRAAKEESQQAIAAITTQYERENQALRQDLLQQQAHLRQELIYHTDATAQARTNELKCTLAARDQVIDEAALKRDQQQEQIRADELLA
jgi:hypothetical protein